MAYMKNSKSAAVRARLDHPVIDGDGHWLEPIPVFLDYLKAVAGQSVVDRFVKKASETSSTSRTPMRRSAGRWRAPSTR